MNAFFDLTALSASTHLRPNPLPNKHRHIYHIWVPHPIRILFLADSHLGLDLPVKPRVGRRRRGFDFLANYSTALAPAHSREVDLVVHGGDVFNRSAPHASVAHGAYEPLTRVADLGIPVFIVPGNHERSKLPHARLLRHRNIHVFDAPRTFVADVRGARVALSGLPYERDDVRSTFTDLVEQTRWREHSDAQRLLCIHHCVEGATVGPGDFTFTTASDVIRGRDIPSSFSAVLSGHIHRHQVLMRDLDRRPLGAPVLYPGSIERTSFAEMGEIKGFMMLELDPGSGALSWSFRELPARPMERHELDGNRLNAASLETSILGIVSAAPEDAVISIRISGNLTDAHWRVMSAAYLRSIIPATMNVDVTPANGFGRQPRTQPKEPAPSLQHALFGD
jgi:exonuclease SbcD